MDVTTDDVYDSEVLPSLVMDVSRYRTIIEACMDGTTIHLRLMLYLRGEA